MLFAPGYANPTDADRRLRAAAGGGPRAEGECRPAAGALAARDEAAAWLAGRDAGGGRGPRSARRRGSPRGPDAAAGRCARAAGEAGRCRGFAELARAWRDREAAVRATLNSALGPASPPRRSPGCGVASKGATLALRAGGSRCGAAHAAGPGRGAGDPVERPGALTRRVSEDALRRRGRRRRRCAAGLLPRIARPTGAGDRVGRRGAGHPAGGVDGGAVPRRWGADRCGHGDRGRVDCGSRPTRPRFRPGCGSCGSKTCPACSRRTCSSPASRRSSWNGVPRPARPATRPRSSPATALPQAVGVQAARFDYEARDSDTPFARAAARASAAVAGPPADPYLELTPRRRNPPSPPKSPLRTRVHLRLIGPRRPAAGRRARAVAGRRVGDGRRRGPEQPRADPRADRGVRGRRRAAAHRPLRC